MGEDFKGAGTKSSLAAKRIKKRGFYLLKGLRGLLEPGTSGSKGEFF